MVGGDLQNLGGVGEPMHLVEDDAGSTVVSKKALRVLDPTTDPRQLAVEVPNSIQGPGEAGFSNASDAPKPDDALPGPGLFKGDLPVLSIPHAISFAHGHTRCNPADVAKRRGYHAVRAICRSARPSPDRRTIAG